MTPKFIDLFCGCGGLSRGLKDAGLQLLAGLDIDELSLETFRKNHPGARVYKEDISEFDPDNLLSDLSIDRGELDLLTGCPPCQGFSSIRTLNGSKKVEDCRNDLIFEFGRYVKTMLPKTLMMENVPGLINDERLEELVFNLKGMDYEISLDVLNAADYEVPQRRHRMILLGSRMGGISFPQKNLGEKITVWDAIYDLPKPGKSGDALHDYGENRTEKIKRLIKNIPKDGGSRKDVDEELLPDCHKDFDGFKDVYGRMSWDDVAPTITGGCVNPSKGRFLHPEQDRAITLREAALLQGFPEDYRISLRRGKHPAAELIGNAFPPPYANHMGKAIIGHLNLG